MVLYIDVAAGGKVPEDCRVIVDGGVERFRLQVLDVLEGRDSDPVGNSGADLDPRD